MRAGEAGQQRWRGVRGGGEMVPFGAMLGAVAILEVVQRWWCCVGARRRALWARWRATPAEP